MKPPRTLLRWWMRHPARTLAIYAPRLLPLAWRRALFVSPDTDVSPWGAPGEWLTEMLGSKVPSEPERGIPEVSVVIVSYRNREMTTLAVESVKRYTTRPFEIIVIDNASDDGTAEWLELRAAGDPAIRLIANGTNRGFAAACNQGLAIARGTVLCLLNNDVVVTPRWIEPLIAVLELPGIGMAGPVTNACGNEARVVARYQSLPEMLAFAEQRRDSCQGESFTISMLAMFCVAMRRATWNAVGPLDERFGIGMFEDDDYARRLQLSGLRSVCVEEVFVHHWGRAAFRSRGADDYFGTYAANRRRFRDKWRHSPLR